MKRNMMHVSSLVEMLGAEKGRSFPLVRLLRPVDTLYKETHFLASRFRAKSLLFLQNLTSNKGLRGPLRSSTYAMSTLASPSATMLETADTVVESSFWDDLESASSPDECRKLVNTFGLHLRNLYEATLNKRENENCLDDGLNPRFLNGPTVVLAVKCLLNCKLDNPIEMSKTIRAWEYHLGSLAKTSLTESLSLYLLFANSHAGNVGRVLALLQLRSSRGYRAVTAEYRHAIDSIHISMSRNGRRNLYFGDIHQPPTENPTRWLDAILLNMKGRNFKLTIHLVNEMLLCYGCRSGPTGKAMHHFYRVVRQPVYGDDIEAYHQSALMPKRWFWIRDNDFDDILEKAECQPPSPVNNSPKNGRCRHLPVKVQLLYHSKPPPFFKIPSQVRGKLLFRNERTIRSKVGAKSLNSTKIPRQQKLGQYRIEREMDPHFSVPLSAAFAFADSIQHGACGHPPIKLNIESYNALIKACVNRGSLWRAMHLIDNVMQPSLEEGIIADIESYNLLLAGLSRVGDVATSQEYMYKLLNAGLTPNKYTVRAIIDGLLNLGDAGGAVTVAQDFFNQHSVLPPVSQLNKILEVCLALDLIYEAKRFFYFIQQLMQWKPNKYHTPEFVRLMQHTQANEQLQKPALKKLFSYFGAELADSDFV